MSTRDYNAIRAVLSTLASYEIDALIDALRRDMRAEELREHEQEHYMNCRHDRGLLEAILPKHAEGRGAVAAQPQALQIPRPVRHIHELALVLVAQSTEVEAVTTQRTG